MPCYKSPLSVYFVWHPADDEVAGSLSRHCFELFQKDTDKPFSRSMNLPVFFRSTYKDGIPAPVESFSDKAVVFVFAGADLMADRNWVDYVEGMDSTEFKIVPVAIDKSAFHLKGNIDYLNFIRLYEFDARYKKDLFFISVAHEIFRYCLNDKFEEKKKGKDNALKLFISHEKDSKDSLKFALAIKDFIDHTPMRNFFDAYDIAPAGRFDDQIEEQLKDSTLIAIHSDRYSSRYWCQREILCAKENSRPIVAVDSLNDLEDRRFPFSSNIPGIHVHYCDENSERDLLRILSAALLETVRFFYSEKLLRSYKNAGFFPGDSYITARPPEQFLYAGLLETDSERNIKRKHSTIIYPDPPVYDEEIECFRKLGFNLATPLTYCNSNAFNGRKIGISIADPSDRELIDIGISRDHLKILAQNTARNLLERGSELIYGGDLRKNGFTEYLFEVAKIVCARKNLDSAIIGNYIAWPIHISETVEYKNWAAKYCNIAEMIKVEPANDVDGLLSNYNPPVSHLCDEGRFIWSRCLTKMRQEMIDNCDIRICAGGKHSGYKGMMPGILEEVLIAAAQKKSIFLLGGFGGMTSGICKTIVGKNVPELTEEWQVHNNPGYKDLLQYAGSKDKSIVPDYSSISETLKNLELNNGLDREDNQRVFSTQFVDEAIFLILKGISNIA